ncbi:MAG: ThuA domain-containing protein, partial [Thermogemmata sp.]
VRDPHLPLLIWWAIEEQATRWLATASTSAAGQTPDAAAAMEWIAQEALTRPDTRPLAEELVIKLARRLIAEERGYHFLTPLAQTYPLPLLLRGIAQGLEGRSLPGVPEPLRSLLDACQREHPEDPLLRVVQARMQVPAALAELRRIVAQPQAPEKDRLTALQVLQQVRDPQAKELFQAQLRASGSDTLRLALLGALEAYDDPALADFVLQQYASLSPAGQRRALQLLLSRPAWTWKLFQQWEAGRFPKAHLTLDHARAAVAHNHPPLTALVEKHFGKLAPATSGEKQARIAWLNTALSREKHADATRGKALFRKLCAACHQLHGEGGKIGPDLTTADRHNRLYLLTHIVDPSAYIRPEYLVQTVLTHDERRLSGIAADQGSTVLLTTVVNDQPVTFSVPKADIADIRPSPVSLMPERLLDSLSDQEVADLFAYLQSQAPPSAPSAPPAKEQTSTTQPAKRRPLRLALISGSFEYKSDASLRQFRKLLEERYALECVLLSAQAEKDTSLPGIEQLQECDAAIFFTRRLRLEGESLKIIQEFARSSKPIVGIRTASHGFQNWLEMDKEIFGGDYQGHYGAGVVCEVRPAPGASEHPVLRGVRPFRSQGSLYKNPRLAPDVQVLLTGTIPSGQTEPVAWVRTLKGRRIFYTSLGHPDDFQDENFQRLLLNALEWTLQQPLPSRR